MTLYQISYVNGVPSYSLVPIKKKSKTHEKQSLDYTCDECGLKFVTETRLKWHCATHNPLRIRSKDSSPPSTKESPSSKRRRRAAAKSNECEANSVKVEGNAPKRILFICPTCDFTTHDRLLMITHFTGSHCIKNSEELKTEPEEEPMRGQYQEVDAETFADEVNEVESLKCDKCGLNFDNQVDLDFHSCPPENDSKQLFSCHICTYECLTRMGLQSHITRKHKPRPSVDSSTVYECGQCEFSCNNKNTLYSHRRKHRRGHLATAAELPDGDKTSLSYFCNECDFATNAKNSLYMHIQRRHKVASVDEGFRQSTDRPNLYTCDQCEYTNKNRYEMKVHVIRKHSNEYNHECEQCGKKYKVRGDLTNHIRFQHREQPIICDVCGKTCGNSNSLYVHQKFAHYKAEFECPICHRRMVTQANLDEHVLKQHEQREDAVCEECGKTFSRQSRLKLHMRIHSGLKPYSCKICSKAFSRTTALRQHLLIHTGQRPYVCDICGKAFTQKPGLISHRKSHPGSHPPLPRVTIDHVLSELLNEDKKTTSTTTTVAVRATGAAGTIGGSRRFVFQKKLVKIRPLPMAANKRMMVGRVTTTTPMEQVFVKMEPQELPTEEFEEVTIDGTGLQNIASKKESMVVYLCKLCKVYFPLSRLLDEHNETFHNAGSQSPPGKKPKESTTVQYNGYRLTKQGVYHCDFCPFSSKVRSTISSHARRKHGDSIKEGAPGLSQSKEEISSPEPNFEISDVEEVDDEDFWPVEVLEDDKPEINEPEINPLDPTAKLRTCPYCPFRTTKNSTYHSHVKRRHRENWLKTIAQKVAALKTELPVEHGVEFKCQYCPFHAEKRSDINEHVLLNHMSDKELITSSKRKREPETEEFEPTESADVEEAPLAEGQEEVVPTAEEDEPRKAGHACTYCPFVTPSKDALRMHVNRRHRSAVARQRTRESGIKRQPKALLCTGYACHYCTFISATVASMRAHTHREHPGQRQPVAELPVTEYDCHQCDYKARSRKNMQLHLKRCHTTHANSEGMFACNVCSYETLSRMGLQRHVSIKHNKPKRDPAAQPVSYVCQDCGHVCLNSKLMDWHRRQHEPPSPEFGGEKDGYSYYCNDCGFSTWTKGQLYSHIRRKHRDADGNECAEGEPQEQIFVCGQCDYTSKNKHLMKVHVIRRHTEEYNHECEQCGKKYKIKADLTNHIRFQHREQPIICDVCGKTCRNSNLLYLHQKFAHYKPDFECHICHRRMVSQANLDEHILKQHEQREDVVCEECGKSFTRAARLKIHMRIHTGVKPYTCKVCFKAFARRNGLRQHLLIHTGQRPYLCDICGKSFTQKTGLISHRKSHPGSHPPLPRITIDHVLSELLTEEA